MKKFINWPEDVVEEMLQGLVVLHPGSVRLLGHKAMVRADAGQIRDQQVAVLSGGGSGHEPAHAGYIGAGMLSTAVVGRYGWPRPRMDQRQPTTTKDQDAMNEKTKTP